MGFLDNLVRSIEDGNLEKAVSSAVDGLGSKLDKAVDTLDKAASKLEKSSQKDSEDSVDPQRP